MKKLVSIAAGLAVVPVLAAGTVFADSPGQLAGGANVFVVKNLTQKGAYGSSAKVTACGDELQYSIELHNTEYGQLTGINVKSTLGSTTSMVATTAAGGTTGTSASVKINGLTSNQTLAYESGSTQLFDAKGTVIKTLADGITAGGVAVGSLDGSTTEFVNFKAKVSCPTPPKQIQVCELATKKIVTINESDFNSSKYTKDLTQCAETPTPPATPTTPAALPNTGAGNVIAVVAGAIVAGTVAARVFMSRKLARKA